MTLTQTQQPVNQANRLEGKVALVTGGSRGIGAAIAKRLAEEGATVAITYAKSRDAADAVVKALLETGVNARAIKADAASPADVQSLVEEVKKSEGKIDILVNNAGVWEGGPIDQVSIEQYERIFDVNVKGPIALTIAALPLISDGGRIINVSSVVAESTFAGMSIYSASKAALSALTRVWAQDLGSRKITVNAVAPGVTATDMFHEALPGDEVHQSVVAKTALGRLGLPEDIAAAVAFLASRDGDWITGQTIRSDGGLN